MREKVFYFTFSELQKSSHGLHWYKNRYRTQRHCKRFEAVKTTTPTTVYNLPEKTSHSLYIHIIQFVTKHKYMSQFNPQPNDTFLFKR